MAKYKVSAIRIEGGVITTETYGTTKSIKSFFEDKSPAIEIFPVAGWRFNRIYLTKGNQEFGFGWAFFK